MYLKPRCSHDCQQHLINYLKTSKAWLVEKNKNTTDLYINPNLIQKTEHRLKFRFVTFHI